MNTQEQLSALRIQLFKMARLSQRAVDYAIKAYALARPEFSQPVLHTRPELSSLEGSIAVRGRALLFANLSADSDLCFVRSAMRICSALRITYTAAAEIAENFMLTPENQRVLQYPALEDIGQFTNSQVRLYTVALFNEQIQHAKEVLKSYAPRQRPGMSFYRPLNELTEAATAQTHFELSTSRNLGQIAEQAHEIAEAIIVWLECQNCIGTSRDRPLPDCRQMYSPLLSA